MAVAEVMAAEHLVGAQQLHLRCGRSRRHRWIHAGPSPSGTVEMGRMGVVTGVGRREMR